MDGSNPVDSIPGGQPGTVPTGPFPPGFHPLVLPERHAGDRLGRVRPYHAEIPKKTVRFDGERGKQLARALEIQAVLDDRGINEELQFLLELGLKEWQRQRRGNYPPFGL